MFPNQKLLKHLPCLIPSHSNSNNCLYNHSIKPNLISINNSSSIKRSISITSQLPPAKRLKPPEPTPTPTPSSSSKLSLFESEEPIQIYSLDRSKSSYIPFQTRQQLINTFTTTYLTLYVHLPKAKELAARDAFLQEEHQYKTSNKATYKVSCIQAIARVKKRSLPRSRRECGTNEQVTLLQQQSIEAEKSSLSKSKLSKFVHSIEVLKDWDYSMEVPEGEGGDKETEEGGRRTCGRCGADFIVRNVLTSVSLTSICCFNHIVLTRNDWDEQDSRKACEFHFGKMVTEKLGG